MSIKVLAGSVVAHGRARVGVPSGDLHVPQVDARIMVSIKPGTEQMPLCAAHCPPLDDISHCHWRNEPT